MIGNDASPSLDCDDHGDPSSEDFAGDYRFLHEIEAMSRALRRPQPIARWTSASSSIQTPSSRKSAILWKGSVLEPGAGDCGEGITACKPRRSSSSWIWKKPLKALSRIRYRKFPCFFFLHVHSIEGLPGSFEESSICVEFMRKDDALRTGPSSVSGGSVDFHDTLMHRCTVYCRKIDGHCSSCKYEPKLFVVRAYVNEAPWIDLGKHRVDLTGLLPVSFDELGAGKSSGKWTTSFKLAGEARGAILNVSIGFSLGDRSVLEYRDDMTVSELISMSYSRSSARRYSSGSRNDGDDSFGRLRRSGSVPSSLQSIRNLALVNPALELSKSIHFVYRTLDEDESGTRSQRLMETVDQDPVKAKGDSGLDTVETTVKDASDELEYVVIDRGIEVVEKEKLDSVQGDAHSHDGPNADDAPRGLGLGHEEEIRWNIDEDTGLNPVDSNFCAREGKDPEECHEELRTKYKTRRICASLDSARADKETGACFPAMHGTKQDSSCGSLGRDPESPRERLLREFKEEALASGSFIIGFDSSREEEEEGSAYEGGDSVVHDTRADPEDSIIASAPKSSPFQHVMQSWSLKVDRRKLNMLEDLETESFPDVRQCDPSGFGSPVELSCA